VTLLKDPDKDPYLHEAMLATQPLPRDLRRTWEEEERMPLHTDLCRRKALTELSLDGGRCSDPVLLGTVTFLDFQATNGAYMKFRQYRMPCVRGRWPSSRYALRCRGHIARYSTLGATVCLSVHDLAGRNGRENKNKCDVVNMAALLLLLAMGSAMAPQ